MRFGVMLPTYAPERLESGTVRRLRTFAERADALGFDSLWVADHMLGAPGMFGGACLSPLLCLAHAAAVTSRIALGTSVLVLPLRHPVAVAKEIATLDSLSEGRVILGIGAGWNPHVFDVAGVPLAERGARAAEAVGVLRRLLSEPSVSHHGRYYRFDGVTVTPRPARVPPIWIAGGAEPGRPSIARGVLGRIVEADGWIARARSSTDMIRADWRAVQDARRAAGRSDGFTFAHLNFLHLVPAEDHEEALRRQQPRFLEAMGTRRSWAELEQSHLTGTTAEIAARIAGLQAVGLDEMILCPLGYDLEQLERYAGDLVPRFRSRRDTHLELTRQGG